MQRMLEKGRILHKGGGRLTQDPRGPRYSSDEPHYQIPEGDCKDIKDAETTASSYQDTESLLSTKESVELVIQANDTDGPPLQEPTEFYEDPLPSASQYQEVPLHSDSSWLSVDHHVAAGSASPDVPDSPRSFQYVQDNDDPIVWDQNGFPVTATHLWVNDEQK
jgi:hypothetical protein